MVDKDPKLHTWCKGIIVPSGLETVEKFPKISPRNFVFRIWRRSARSRHATLPNNSYDPKARNMTPQLGPAMFRILTETDSIDPCIVGLGRDLSTFCVQGTHIWIASFKVQLLEEKKKVELLLWLIGDWERVTLNTPNGDYSCNKNAL